MFVLLKKRESKTMGNEYRIAYLLQSADIKHEILKQANYADEIADICSKHMNDAIARLEQTTTQPEEASVYNEQKTYITSKGRIRIRVASVKGNEIHFYVNRVTNDKGEWIEMPLVVFDSRGESGNIFSILAEVYRKKRKEYNDIYAKVKQGNYTDALATIREYVDLVDIRGEM